MGTRGTSTQSHVLKRLPLYYSDYAVCALIKHIRTTNADEIV